MVYKLCTRGQTKQERASPFWRNRAMDRHCLSDPRRGPLQRRDEPRLQALLGVALRAGIDPRRVSEGPVPRGAGPFRRRQIGL